LNYHHFSVILQEPGGNTSKEKSMAENFATVRYMVGDVGVSITFYTTHLGFELQHRAGDAFASVTRGPLRLLLSGKASSGADAMPDGRQPIPGGWSRILIEFPDLAAEVARLKSAKLQFRNEIHKGVGGSQIILDDPSGNPIELFQPAK
jgi:catechol 2,3-dioxygenase-like lactoylglutathione lyase family enzyme